MLVYLESLCRGVTSKTERGRTEGEQHKATLHDCSEVVGYEKRFWPSGRYGPV